jgi:serine/threonine protein kinase
MQHVHQRGILHRDLKPSNVLLMADDVPKVTDFGLAKFTPTYDPEMMTVSMPPWNHWDLSTALRRDSTGTEEIANDDRPTNLKEEVIMSEWKKSFGTPSIGKEVRLDAIRQFIQEAIRQASSESPGETEAHEKLTKLQAIMGTPQYMSPEQALGHISEVGLSTDIYSLGAIMYEMLTGRPPFTGSMPEILIDVISRPPVPPRQMRDSIEPGLEAICMRCLEKKAEDRYESMGCLADDLQRYMSGERVRALPDVPTGGKTGERAGGGDDPGTTRTWVPGGTTEPAPSRRRNWWRFWA